MAELGEPATEAVPVALDPVRVERVGGPAATVLAELVAQEPEAWDPARVERVRVPGSVLAVKALALLVAREPAADQALDQGLRRAERFERS